MNIGSIIFIIGIIAFLLVVYVVYQSSKRGFSTSVQKKIQGSWGQISSMQDFNHAILEADKLLDFVLLKKGYTGSLGNKLKAGGKLFSDLNGIWSAHKLRNTIAHELHHKVNEREYSRAIKSFLRGLRDLGCEI